MGEHVHAYICGRCRCGKDPYQVEGELRAQIQELRKNAFKGMQELAAAQALIHKLDGHQKECAQSVPNEDTLEQPGEPNERQIPR